MRGFCRGRRPAYDTGEIIGRRDGWAGFRLTIGAPDLRAVIADPNHHDRHRQCGVPEFAPVEMPVTAGTFEIFVPVAPRLALMRYLLPFTTPDGIRDDAAGLQGNRRRQTRYCWTDTTRCSSGCCADTTAGSTGVTSAPNTPAAPCGWQCADVRPATEHLLFFEHPRTSPVSAGSSPRSCGASTADRPGVPTMTAARWTLGRRLPGRRRRSSTCTTCAAARSRGAQAGGAGARSGVRANLFRDARRVTVVDRLIEAGWDVWLEENWRASIDLPATNGTWTRPRSGTIRTQCENTGAHRFRHRQGRHPLSGNRERFDAVGGRGLLPQVDTIVSEFDVACIPWSPAGRWVKLFWLVPRVAPLLRYLDPRWGHRVTAGLGGAGLVAMVNAAHRECDSRPCRMISFTYGAARPISLWSLLRTSPNVPRLAAATNSARYH